MDKMIEPQYHECIALIDAEPDATYVVEFHGGGIFSMRGSQMKGFLVASDTPAKFWRF